MHNQCRNQALLKTVLQHFRVSSIYWLQQALGFLYHHSHWQTDIGMGTTHTVMLEWGVHYNNFWRLCCHWNVFLWNFQDHLTDLLDTCAHMLERAERYELLGEIYRLIIPIFERKRDFEVRFFSCFDCVCKYIILTKLTYICLSGLLQSVANIWMFYNSFSEDSDYFLSSC